MMVDRRSFLRVAAVAAAIAQWPAQAPAASDAADAVEAFAAVRSYWTSAGYKYVQKLSGKRLSSDDLRALALRMLALCRDKTVDGIVFTPKHKTIRGNDKECLRGTILDVHAPSEIQPHQQRVAVIAKNVLAALDGRPQYARLCSSACVGCAAVDTAVCVKTLQETFDAVFQDGGVFDACEEKVKGGRWKL